MIHTYVMRISVEIDDRLVREVMRLTGETKMSAAVAKAAELFTNRKKAVEIVRSLREDPLDYSLTNDQIEHWEDLPAGTSSVKNPLKRTRKVSYRKK